MLDLHFLHSLPQLAALNPADLGMLTAIFLPRVINPEEVITLVDNGGVTEVGRLLVPSGRVHCVSACICPAGYRARAGQPLWAIFLSLGGLNPPLEVRRERQ